LMNLDDCKTSLRYFGEFSRGEIVIVKSENRQCSHKYAPEINENDDFSILTQHLEIIILYIAQFNRQTAFTQQGRK
jgi:hypothetical protein